MLTCGKVHKHVAEGKNKNVTIPLALTMLQAQIDLSLEITSRLPPEGCCHFPHKADTSLGEESKLTVVVTSCWRAVKSSYHLKWKSQS